MAWKVVGGQIGRKVLCQCSCGTKQYIDKYNLRNGNSTRCAECRKKLRTVPRITFRCRCGTEKVMREAQLRGKDEWRCRACADAGRRSFDCNVPKTVYIRLANAAKGAIRRCNDPGHESWGYYGGRGIKVFPEWVNNPALFIEYLYTLEGHDDHDLELDRADNNGDYLPGNLRFVTHSVSMKNRRERARDASGRFI